MNTPTNMNTQTNGMAYPQRVNDSESSRRQTDMVKGDYVYHGNPIGNNYQYAGLKGEIISFVNMTNKRAIVQWENGVEKKHNVRSLVTSPPTPPSTMVKARKKRKYGGKQSPKKKRKMSPLVLKRDSSLIPLERLNSGECVDNANTLIPDNTFDWWNIDNPTSFNNVMFDDMLDDMFNESTSKSESFSSTTIVDEKDSDDDDEELVDQLIDKLLGPVVHLPNKHAIGITI